MPPFFINNCMKKNFENSLWWNIPAYLDRWRIFPRIFISMYIYLLYETVTWFMALEAPTMEQAGLISVIFSVGGFWFNSYLSVPPKKLKNNFTDDVDYTQPHNNFDYNNEIPRENTNDKLY